MTAEINDCLAQLKTDLDDKLVDVYADKVYGFRILPLDLERTISLTHLSTLPKNLAKRMGVSKTAGRMYDIGIIVKVRHDGTEEGLEAAELTINAMENAIYDYAETSQNTLWFGILFPRPSNKPRVPGDIGKKIRYGEIFLRLQLR